MKLHLHLSQNQNPNVSTLSLSSLSATRLTPSGRSATPTAVRVPMAATSPLLATAAPSTAALEAVAVGERPDRFRRFGGNCVLETLMYALTELETAFEALSKDPNFSKCKFGQICASATHGHPLRCPLPNLLHIHDATLSARVVSLLRSKARHHLEPVTSMPPPR